MTSHRQLTTTIYHGTTLRRGQQILRNGPDLGYKEPGGVEVAESFSACLKGGPFPCGRPEEYARSKAASFPAEGGGAVVEIVVPNELLELFFDEFFTRAQGLVQVERGPGYEVLHQAWPLLTKNLMILAKE